MDHIRKTLDRQDKQLELSQRTARLQLFTYLTDLHHKIARESPAALEDTYLRRTEYFAKQALNLLSELDPEISFPSEVAVPSRLMHAKVELQRIAEKYRQERDELQSDPSADGRAARLSS